MATLQELGLLPELSPFEVATPIQQQVIPPILRGEDVVGIAETGSGKTAAYGLPTLQRLKARSGCAPRALIVAPTRELATQIGGCIEGFAANTTLRVNTVTGGVDLSPQVRRLEAGVDVLVGTPGRLTDLLRRNVLDLSEICVLIVDEADQLLDQGFKDDLLQLAAAADADQTLLFSATLPPKMNGLLAKLLTDPTTCRLDDRPPEQLEQRVYYVNNNHRLTLLVHLLEADSVERALVFTRTRKAAEVASTHLCKAGLRAAPLHGEKSQAVRTATLADFVSGTTEVLVATDVAARGLDLPNVTHVFNLGMPHEPETYIHRVGRTARAGRGGLALSLCSAEDAGRLRDVERLTGVPLAPVLDHPWIDFSAIPNSRATAIAKGEKRKRKKGRRR